LDLMDFEGVKIYNMGREWAIAVVDKGKVALSSSLDSLYHPKLQMAVASDLQRYGDMEAVEFHMISLGKDSSLFMHTPYGTVGIVEHSADFRLFSGCRFLLWRKISKQHLPGLSTVPRSTIVLFDG